MIPCIRMLAGGLALLCIITSAQAQDGGAEQTPANPPQDEPAPKLSAPLTKEEIAGALQTDTMSVPTPGELMAALNKIGKPDWASKFRAPIDTSYPSRAQMALNLGGLIADGYLAVEAQHTQQVKNIGKDILALGTKLGVKEDIINRGSSLTDFAENKQWDALKEELESTQNEVKLKLAENKDQDLISLVTLGGWVRGLEVLSSWIGEHYSDAGAKLLRQPAVVHMLSSRLNDLPEKVRDDPAVRRTREKLTAIEAAVSFPREKIPSQEDVKKVHELAADLIKDLAKKNQK